jgi:hypothetical protein
MKCRGSEVCGWCASRQVREPVNMGPMDLRQVTFFASAVVAPFTPKCTLFERAFRLYVFTNPFNYLTI